MGLFRQLNGLSDVAYLVIPMGNEPSSPTGMPSKGTMDGLLQTSVDCGLSWQLPKFFHLSGGKLQSQDQSESYELTNAKVSMERGGNISLSRSKRTVITLRVAPGALQAEADVIQTWYRQLRDAAKLAKGYSSVDQNISSSEAALVLLACIVFNFTAGIQGIACEYKADTLSEAQAEVVGRRSVYESAVGVMKKLLAVQQTTNQSNEIGTLEFADGIAFRYIMHACADGIKCQHEQKGLLVVTCWAQSLPADATHMDGQAAFQQLDSQGSRILGLVAEPVSLRVLSHSLQLTREQLATFIVEQERNAAKSENLNKKVEIKIDSLNRKVANDLIPLARKRSEHIQKNIVVSGHLEDSTSDFKTTAGTLKWEKQWELCKWNMAIASIVFIILLGITAVLYYLL